MAPTDRLQNFEGAADHGMLLCSVGDVGWQRRNHHAKCRRGDGLTAPGSA